MNRMRTSLLALKYSPWFRPIVALTLFFTATLAMYFISIISYDVKIMHAENYLSYDCNVEKTSTQESKPTFYILDLVHLNTNLLADALCEDPNISERYGAVQVNWEYRDNINIGRLVDQDYSLILSKRDLMARIENVDDILYTPIIVHDNYRSYLISLDSKPKLTKDYLREKVMGLVESPESKSGHQIPKMALRSKGINEDVVRLRYYKTHWQLQSALNNGEVDLIASFFPSLIPSLNDRAKTLLLRSELLGFRWYLSSKLIDTQQHCSVDKKIKPYLQLVAPALNNNVVTTRLCRYETI